MNKYRISRPFFPLLLLISGVCFGQNVDWKRISPENKHLIYATAGFYFGTIASVGYGYRLKASPSILLNAEFSCPFGRRHARKQPVRPRWLVRAHRRQFLLRHPVRCFLWEKRPARVGRQVGNPGFQNHAGASVVFSNRLQPAVLRFASVPLCCILFRGR